MAPPQPLRVLLDRNYTGRRPHQAGPQVRVRPLKAPFRNLSRPKALSGHHRPKGEGEEGAWLLARPAWGPWLWYPSSYPLPCALPLLSSYDACSSLKDSTQNPVDRSSARGGPRIPFPAALAGKLERSVSTEKAAALAHEAKEEGLTESEEKMYAEGLYPEGGACQ